MNGIELYAKGVLAAVGGTMIYWLGGLDQLLTALIAVMVVDYGTGLAGAYLGGRISSKKGFAGIAKKVLLLSVVALAFIIQQLMDDAIALREVTITFFVVNEGISILENAADMGVPIPKKLRLMLEQLGKQADDDQP